MTINKFVNSHFLSGRIPPPPQIRQVPGILQDPNLYLSLSYRTHLPLNSKYKLQYKIKAMQHGQTVYRSEVIGVYEIGKETNRNIGN